MKQYKTVNNLIGWITFLIAATVYCMVGDNVRKHPDVFQMVIDNGHRIGNHTFNHIRGFEFGSDDYLANTDKANGLIKTNLFRPPHGHMEYTIFTSLAEKTFSMRKS